MRIKDIRILTTENLQEELSGVDKELFNLRFQKATQQLADTNAIRKARKKAARIKTVLRERQLAKRAAKR
jgi:large subunit ribosomal protein L29